MWQPADAAGAVGVIAHLSVPRKRLHHQNLGSNTMNVLLGWGHSSWPSYTAFKLPISSSIWMRKPLLKPKKMALVSTLVGKDQGLQQCRTTLHFFGNG